MAESMIAMMGMVQDLRGQVVAGMGDIVMMLDTSGAESMYCVVCSVIL
jgi:hypothetical protein